MRNSETRISRSPDETMELARQLGEKARPGNVFALFGDLGSGKTVMAKGIALGLGINSDITSPTFTLMEVYRGRYTLYHFDLYRIESPDEFENLFFEEYWQGDGISVIEWAERAGNRLPDNIIRIYMSYIDDTGRSITIEYPCD